MDDRWSDFATKLESGESDRVNSVIGEISDVPMTRVRTDSV